MAYIKQSVPRPTVAGKTAPGAADLPKDKVTILDVDDIATFPSRDDGGIVIAENIVMAKDAYPVQVYMTPGTFELTSAAEGDPDKEGFKPQIKFSHPGNEKEVREFRSNYLGSRTVVIVEYCNGRDPDIIGSPCNPCQFTPSYTGNKDGSATEMTFAQMNPGADIGIYKGAIPSQTTASTPS